MDGQSSQMQTGSDNEPTGTDSNMIGTSVLGNKRKRNKKNQMSKVEGRKKMRLGTSSQVSDPMQPSDQQSQKPKARGLETGLHGTVFQLHLTMLFLCRGLSKGYSYELFKEKSEFLPFDDIVFIYKKPEDPNNLYRFLQAKHKQDKKAIEMSDLEKDMNESDNIFALQKYYDGYRRIIQQEKVKISEIKDFVICTNVPFSEELKHSAKEILDENGEPVKDDILYYDDYSESVNDQDRPVLYNLDLETTEQGRELFQKLCLISDLSQLARDLVEAVSRHNVILNEKFIKYHVALMKKNVIAINPTPSIIKRESKKDIELNGKFHESFKDLAIEDRSFENFRSAFREEAFKKVASEMEIRVADVKNDELDQLNEDVAKQLVEYAIGELKNLHCFKLLRDTKLIQKVRNKDIYKFKKDFIRGNSECSFKDSFSKEIFNAMVENYFVLDDNFGKIITYLDNVGDFVEKFAKVLEKHRPTESKTIEIERCDEMVEDICKLAKYVLVESNGTIMFHPKFFDDDELPFNLNDFKTSLKNRIRFEFNELAEYRFQIKSFPKFDLPDESMSPENDVKVFLNKLIFAVNQPDDNALRDIISKNENIRELGFVKRELLTDHFQNEILEWLASRQKCSYNAKKVKRFFEDLKVEITNLVFLSLSLSYMADIRKFGIEFKEDLQIFKKAREMHREGHKNKTLVIHHKSALLTEIKMCQVLKGCCERHIFLNVKSLLSLCQDNSFNPGNAFKSGSIHSVTLVLDHAFSERTQELVREFFDVLTGKTETKLILIVEKKHKELVGKILSSFLRKLSSGYIEEYRMEDDENKFSDLADSSEKKLLQKRNLLFKKEKVSLGEFIGINNLDNLTVKNLNDLNEIVDPDTLSALIMDDEIQIANQPPLYEFEHSHIDIHRVFNRRSKIRLTECLDKNTRDKFSVSCIDEKELRTLVPPHIKICDFGEHYSKSDLFREKLLAASYKNRLFIVNSESTEKWLCQKYYGCNIHFLKYEDKNLIWQKSHGNLNGLCKFLINEEFKPRTIADFNDRVVLIASEPGMGKSTVLTRLWEQSEKDLWVSRITVRDHKEKLKSANFNDLEGIIIFLSDIGILETALSKSLMLLRLKQQGKVFLLVDGYDEVEKHLRIKVVQLVKTLSTKTQAGHIWVTTRTYLQQELQQELGLFSYTLNPFDKSDQEKYLLEFWKEKCKLEETDERMMHYANELLKYFKIEENCIGIALQTQMLAEVFRENFENFYRDCSQSEPDFEQSGKDLLVFRMTVRDHKEKLKSANFNGLKGIINLHDLYERFIDIKYEIHLREKINVGRNLRSGELQALIKFYEKTHGYLSLEALFPFCSEGKNLLDTQKGSCSKEESAIIGIIRDFYEKHVNFVHLTYAEYFAADFVIGKLKKEFSSNKFKLIYEFLLRQIFRDRNKIIRSFIQEKLRRELDDHLNGKWKMIIDCDLITNSRPLLSIKDSAEDGRVNLFIHEMTLEDCKEDVGSVMSSTTEGYRYELKDDKELNKIKILFKRFLMETDIKQLKSTLVFLLERYNKFILYVVNREISENIINAASHFLTQAKTQNVIDHNLIDELLTNLFSDSAKLKIFELINCSAENEKRTLSKDLIELLILGDTKANKYRSVKDNSKLEYQNAKKFLFFLIELLYPDKKSYIEYAIEDAFTNRDYKWLETIGVEIVTGFEIFTPEISDFFSSILSEPIYSDTITGYDEVYAEKILGTLILPMAEKIKEEVCSRICRLELIKMLVHIFEFMKDNDFSLEITQNQFVATLELIEKELEGNRTPQREVISKSAKYLYLLGKLGLKIINFEDKFLVLHPVSEIQYEIFPQYKDKIIESIKSLLRNT